MILNRVLDFERSQSVNSLISIFSIVLLGVLSVVVLFVAPVLLGAMVEYLDFSEAQAGYIISAELAGMAIATFLALFLARRSNWRVTLLVAMSCMIAGNVVSFFVSDFSQLLKVRFLVGIADGVSMAHCVAIIGLTRNPDKTFGFWVTGQLLFGSVGLYVLPNLFPVFGYSFVYLLVAVLMVVMLFFLRFLPQKGKDTGASNEIDGSIAISRRLIIYGYLGLAAILVFYVGQYGVWAYLERIAGHSQLSPQAIGKALSLATMVGVVGALSAAMLGARFGRLLPIGLGMMVSLISMTMLLGQVESREYVIAACAFSFTFNFVLPYLMACITKADVTGRFIMLTNVASGGGLAGGPALAAILQEQSGYDAVIWAGVVFTGLSFLLIRYLALYDSRAAELE
ncbi:MAG: MFS transporter [Gammaproteobacteria bacterium]|nr:MFS transporter [Gammaproteobacteria bacterium]